MFITRMAKEIQYCCRAMKKHLDTKYWICDNTFVKGEVEIKDHCHFTGNNREIVISA